jgi:hypothetical protein
VVLEIKLSALHKITEIMIDGISNAEIQLQDTSSVDHGIRKYCQLGTKDKVGTHFRGHGSVKQKWIADGHIAVIDH